jgi:hypothetical protein
VNECKPLVHGDSGVQQLLHRQFPAHTPMHVFHTLFDAEAGRCRMKPVDARVEGAWVSMGAKAEAWCLLILVHADASLSWVELLTL